LNLLWLGLLIRTIVLLHISRKVRNTRSNLVLLVLDVVLVNLLWNVIFTAELVVTLFHVYLLLWRSGMLRVRIEVVLLKVNVLETLLDHADLLLVRWGSRELLLRDEASFVLTQLFRLCHDLVLDLD
jgi:hypothetical protein